MESGTHPDAESEPDPLTTGGLMPYDAVIFDMDGVVTNTAGTHAEAWKATFDTVLADPRAGAPTPPDPFDIDADYRLFVDGRAREDGVKSFLASRGIDLPQGQPGDTGADWTVRGLAVRKNEMYLRLLATHGLRVFASTVALLRRLRSGGVATGLVTASRNVATILAASDLEDLSTLL